MAHAVVVIVVSGGAEATTHAPQNVSALQDIGG
jgi:hypothetical protein